ncbi:MAG: hypothetical protein WAN35_15060 [Terracidiphilus sp.]
MKDRETSQFEDTFNFRNFILSVAGAVLLTAIGFCLIYWLAFWLVSRWMILEVSHPYLSTIALFAFWILIYSLTSVICAKIQTALKSRQAELQRRIDGKEPLDPKQKILSL